MARTTPDPLAVRKQMDLDSPVATIWRAISEPGRMALWFSDEVRARSLGPGSTGQFVWKEHGAFSFEVEVVEPPARLVWRWAREPDVALDSGPWTRVEWRLSELPDGRIRLSLLETGFIDEKARGENDHGWDQELGELAENLSA